VLGYLDLKWYATLESVFGDNEPVAATDPSPTTSTPSDNTASSTTTSSAPRTLDSVDRLNILLLGGDFGVGRTGVRTDTMITVSIDPETGEIAMFQVPRNWTYSPLPDGMGIWDCDCYPELINELWVMGERHPDAFPGPGDPSENAVKGVISEFLGIPIHYYALVNLDGFVDIIDALGGVEIYVPQQIVDDEYPTLDGGLTRLVIEPGLQEMDGELALAYARTRHQDSDYFRMSRQRCVLEAVVEQASPTAVALSFPRFADIIRDTVTTDLPLDVLRELVVETYPRIDQDAILSIRFIPPEYHLKFRDDGKLGRIANLDLVHEHVDLVIEDPARAVIELGLDEQEECPVPPGT
jgi:LCP family protein required for cell wall assembly